MDEQESKKDRLELQLQMDLLETQQNIYKRLKGIDISLGIITFVVVIYWIIIPLFGMIT